MALIDDVKRSLRITNTAMDSEVESLIYAAISDLHISGVTTPNLKYDTSDYLLKQAIILYSKAFFGISNPDSEKYKTAYDNLKTQLCLSAQYVV